MDRNSITDRFDLRYDAVEHSKNIFPSEHQRLSESNYSLFESFPIGKKTILVVGVSLATLISSYQIDEKSFEDIGLGLEKFARSEFVRDLNHKLTDIFYWVSTPSDERVIKSVSQDLPNL